MTASTTDKVPSKVPAGDHPPAGREKGGRRHMTDRARSEQKLGWTLAGPAFVIMLLVTAYPILYSVYLSFQRYRLSDPDDRAFVGIDNYTAVLTSSLWWQSFLTTVLLTAVTVAIELVIGMVFALVMHRATFGRKVVRTAILIPYGVITVVSSFAWKYAFDSNVGLKILNADGEFNWFGGYWSSLFVVALAEIWKTTPFISLLLLSGLAQVPDVLDEAAEVDGATAWQRLFKVTIPNMKSAIMVAVLFRTLDAFRIFDSVFVMTEGAYDTETLSFLSYKQMIQRVNLGLGSAVSVLLFICVVMIAAVFIKGFKVDIGAAQGGK